MEDYLKGREMRTVVKDEKSEWREVKSGVPQNHICDKYYFSIHKLVLITFNWKPYTFMAIKQIGLSENPIPSWQKKKKVLQM